MMHELIYFLVSCGALYAMYSIFNEGDRSKTDYNVKEFFMIRQYLRVGCFLLFMGLFGFSGLMYFPITIIEFYILPVLLFLVFIIFGILMLLYYFNHKVYLEDNGLLVISFLRKKQKVMWSEIKEIKFNKRQEYLILITNHSKIKVGLALYNVKALVREIQGNTNLKIKGIKQFLKRLKEV